MTPSKKGFFIENKQIRYAFDFSRLTKYSKSEYFFPEANSARCSVKHLFYYQIPITSPVNEYNRMYIPASMASSLSDLFANR